VRTLTNSCVPFGTSWPRDPGVVVREGKVSLNFFDRISTYHHDDAGQETFDQVVKSVIVVVKYDRRDELRGNR
jgi:hypothetical protein